MTTRMGQRATILVVACALAGCADPKEPALKNDSQDIAVSIAVPLHDGQRTVFADREKDHFHVVIENISKKPQKIWSEQCSWGYDCLTFEITDQNGATSTAKKKPVGFFGNMPVAITLAPGDKLVLEAYPRAESWQGFLLPEKGSRKVTMRAVFEIPETDLAKKNQVWTGKAASAAQDYVFVVNSK
jgi:hypothetical protein